MMYTADACQEEETETNSRRGMKTNLLSGIRVRSWAFQQLPFSPEMTTQKRRGCGADAQSFWLARVGHPETDEPQVGNSRVCPPEIKHGARSCGWVRPRGCDTLGLCFLRWGKAALPLGFADKRLFISLIYKSRARLLPRGLLACVRLRLMGAVVLFY